MRFMSRKQQGEGIVLNFGDALKARLDRNALFSEAVTLEKTVGRNAYSDFLRAHGRRPSPAEAATMGRLMQARVMASDGSLQPPLSRRERKARSEFKVKERRDKRFRLHVLRLRKALAALSENSEPPADVLVHVGDYVDAPFISEQLEPALSWLNRFAEEWQRRAKLKSLSSS